MPRLASNVPHILVADLFEGRPRKPGNLARTLVLHRGRFQLELLMKEGWDNTYAYLVSVVERVGQQDTVQVFWTEANYGGVRPWLSCPECGACRDRLYLVNLKLVCRVCAKLPYKSQRLDKAGRRHARIIAIRAKLQTSSMHRLPARPPGMHRSTYRRLTSELIDLLGEMARAAGEEVEMQDEKLRAFQERIEHTPSQRNRAPAGRRPGAADAKPSLASPKPTLGPRGSELAGFEALLDALLEELRQSDDSPSSAT